MDQHELRAKALQTAASFQHANHIRMLATAQDIEGYLYTGHRPQLPSEKTVIEIPFDNQVLAQIETEIVEPLLEYLSKFSVTNNGMEYTLQQAKKEDGTITLLLNAKTSSSNSPE